MEHKFCGKCGSQLDSKTGLCPICEADAIAKVREKNEKSSIKRTKLKGISTIVILVIIIIAIISTIMVAFNKGWIGTTKEIDQQQVKTTYITYLNRVIVPNIGVFDADHPEKGQEGIDSVLISDLNKDDKSELVVAYTQKNGNNIDFKISCYEYDEDIKLKTDEVTADIEDSIELIGTVTPSTEVDYSNGFIDDIHMPNECILYTVEYDGVTYVIYEHITWYEGYSYEAHVYSINEGKFEEVSNLFVPNIGSDGTEISYSKMLPSGMNVDNSNIDFSAFESGEYIKENYVSNGEIILYYVEGGEYDYEYNSNFASTTDSVIAFFNCYGITRTSAVKWDESNSNGRYILIDKPENVNYIYSYVYYIEHDYENDTEMEKYEITDYTDLKSLITDYKSSIDGELPTQDEPEVVELSNDDIVSFENMLSKSYFIWNNKSVDFNTLSTEDLICKYIMIDSVPMGIYTSYFEFSYENDLIMENQDPQSKYFASYRMKADNVDWIIKNVFDREPDRNVISDDFYYEGDYVYRSAELGGGLESTYIVTDYSDIGNGKIKFNAKETNEVDGDTGFEITVVASPSTDENGNRFWKLYQLN